MNSKDESPWLLVDEADDEVIVGNRAGLIALREKIDGVLGNSAEDPAIGFDDTNIDRVILETKERYLGARSSHQETFGQKIAGLLLALWFVVLPFVAIGLTVYLLFFNEADSDCNSTSLPMHRCTNNVLPIEPG